MIQFNNVTTGGNMNQVEENKREQIDYGKPVGIKDGSIYFLDYVFNHHDGFKGATGTILDPIAQSEIDENNDPENVKEWYRDIWQQSVESGNTENSLNDFVEECIDHCDGEFPGHDMSYSEYHDEAFKHFDDDVKTFNCSGGGRCFDHKLLNSFDTVIDQSLIDLIKKYED